MRGFRTALQLQWQVSSPHLHIETLAPISTSAIPRKMSSPNPPQIEDSKPELQPTLNAESPEISQEKETTSEKQIPEGSIKEGHDNEENEEEEELGECGFCLFMKGGGCKDAFIEWEKCIEEAETQKDDIAEKCFQVTAALKTCMEAHPDYYAPILRAEKAAEEEAAKELEKQKEKETLSSKEEDGGTSDGAEQKEGS